MIRVSLVFFLSLAVSSTIAPQTTQPAPTTPTRDTQSVAIFGQAVKAMGGSVPSDSTATGAITRVAGSLTENGTITILTRGTSQTSEQIAMPSGQTVVIYSNGQAMETTPSGSSVAFLELVVTDQSPDFPLPWLVAALNNPDESLQFIGLETLNGVAALHVQATNTFASQPALHTLAPFSVQDIWFSASSGLPLKVAYTRRMGGGAAPSIPVELFFSNYAKENGVLYPMQILKSFNGTPWQTITIQSVAFNTGLTDAQFPVQQH